MRIVELQEDCSRWGLLPCITTAGARDGRLSGAATARGPILYRSYPGNIVSYGLKVFPVKAGRQGGSLGWLRNY